MTSKIKNFIEKFCLKNKENRLFCLFFFFYVLFGFLFSYRMVIKENIYFGADNWRAYLDLSDITYNHYRIKVHPLFLFFGQPFVFILKGIFCDIKIAIIVLEGIIGSYIVCILHKILELLNIEKRNSLIFTLIYGFSFSQIIFSAVPETFIFSGFWLILYWYFILYLYKNNNGKNHYKTEIAFVIFGITSFGLTITNYVAYFIGLFFFFVNKKQNFKKAIVNILKINIINAFTIGFLCILQKIIWNECPIFITSIIKGLVGKGYEEVAYMNWDFGLNKFIVWAKGIFMYSILSPSVLWINDGYEHLWFGEYNIFIFILLLLFYILFLFSIFSYFNKKKNITKPYKIYIISLLIVFCSHIGLHFIYGSRETFMYTPHYFYILFIIYAFSFNTMTNQKTIKFNRLFLLVFLFIEIIINFYYAYISAKISLEAHNSTISIVQSVVGALCCFTVIYLVLCILEFLEKKYDFEALLLGTKNFLSIFLRNIKIFGVIILVICLFICFTHFNLSIYHSWLLKVLKYIRYLK